jgi:hypothetical protein
MITLMCGKTGRIILGFLFFAASILASDLSGIWAGKQQNQRGEPEDVAFRFKVEGQSLTGKMFGDEFDLAITDGSLSGDQVQFTVITTNYYSKRQVKFTYTGTLKGNELELVRKRVQAPEEKPATRPQLEQTVKLKRLT